MNALIPHTQPKTMKGGRPPIPRHAEDTEERTTAGAATGGFLFYPGLHQPHDAAHFDRCCISIHRLERRKKRVDCPEVFVDSGAFTKLAKHGCYPEPVETYAAQLHRLWTSGVVRIAVASCQDYMCEPFMLAKTGLTVADHQRLTVERYDALVAELNRLFDGPPPFPVMPVLQGFALGDYLRHIDMYGDRLTRGMWVGVGSVCKRQGNVAVIEDLLFAIKEVRPDLRLHGFRREVDRASEPGGAPPAALSRQHGVVVCCSESGPRWERLARGQDVRAQSPSAISRAGTAPAFRDIQERQMKPEELARLRAAKRLNAVSEWLLTDEDWNDADSMLDQETIDAMRAGAAALDHTAKLEEALRQARGAVSVLARKEIPARPSGNAGAYSILHDEIRAARTTLAKIGEPR